MSETTENNTTQGVENEPASQPENRTDQTPGTDQASEDQGKTDPEAPKPIDPRDRALRRQAYDLRELRRQNEQLLNQFRQQQPKQDPNAPPSQADIERLVEQRAAERLEQQRSAERWNGVMEKGHTEMGATDFDDACNVVADMGGASNPAFMNALVRLPHAHRVIAALAAAPAEADRILNLPPLELALAMADLSHKAAAAPAPKPHSRAPEPIRPIQTTGKQSDRLEDLDGDDFLRAWNKRSRS